MVKDTVKCQEARSKCVLPPQARYGRAAIVLAEGPSDVCVAFFNRDRYSLVFHTWSQLRGQCPAIPSLSCHECVVVAEHGQTKDYIAAEARQ